MIEKAKVTLEVTAKITDEFIEFQSEAIGTAFGRWGYKKSDIEKALIELEAYKGTALTPNEIVSLKERKNDGERFEFDFANVKSFDCKCGRHFVNTGIEEIQQYREIGPVEECREAVGKQKPKKRIYPKTALERYYHAPECPNCKRELKPRICGYTLSQAIGIYSYCPWCGQNLEDGEESEGE